MINERAASTKSLVDKCETLRIENAKIRKQIPQYVKTCQQFADFIEKTEERNAKQVDERSKLFDTVKQCRIQNIQKLIKFIFPLSQRISKGDVCATLGSSSSTNTTAKSSPTEQSVTSIPDNRNVSGTASGSSGGSSGGGGGGGGGGGITTDVCAIERGTIVSAETLNALAEATQTTYIRGRWVLQDNRGELQHVIVAPSLPGINIFILSFVHVQVNI